MTTVSKIDNKYYINFTDPSTGDTRTVEVTELDPNNPKSLKLPDNPSNRKYISMDKIDKAPGQVLELTYKESVHIDRKPTDKKPDIEYLTDEEKAVYQSLMDKIKERKQAEKDKNKALSDREKLAKKIEMLKKQLEELE